MKKVDIITRHAIANYGSILQSYATQKILEKYGYDSEIIDYVKKEERGYHVVKVYCKNLKFWNKNFFTRAIYYITQAPNYEISYRKFKKFRKRILKLTKRHYESFQELKDNPPEADIYCTGSDQVWTKIGTEKYDRAYFLEFVPPNSKCISYAASFGKEEIAQELQKNLKQLLKKYSRILVREESAIKILMDNRITNAKQVLDPTLLLKKEEWQKICAPKIKETDYVLVYQLHQNKQFEEYADKFSKKVGLKLIRLSCSMNSFLGKGKLIYMPTPEEFLKYFEDAKFVLTDSFHGTVFSLIFNKKFIDILPKNTGTRIESILKVTNLEDRILKDYSDFSIVEKEINYNEVNQIMESERKKSLEILKKALEEF